MTGLIHTERSMLEALHERYGNSRYIHRGNGPRWVCAEHVRNNAGFEAQRTADFMAVDTWLSSGLAVHGHEVKVSRSDWLSELKAPWKSLPFREIIDYWWIVAPSTVIVRPEELPPEYGLMVLDGNGFLRAQVTAPRLNDLGAAVKGTWGARRTELPPLPRGFVAALLRGVQRCAKDRAVPITETG